MANTSHPNLQQVPLNQELSEQEKQEYEQALKDCDQTYKAICKKLRKQSGYVVDWLLVDKAWNTCKALHGAQTRKSGELYICHPRSVMEELARLRCKTSVLAAALLHDTMEDCKITYEELREDFSDEIAQIVCAVTAIKGEEKAADPHFASMSPEDRHIYLDRLTDAKLISSPYQREAFLVRFADRVHNLSTITACLPGKRLEKIQSTRDFLIPAAHKLGMHYFETVLSDYCMRYDEEDYKNNESCHLQRQRDALISVNGTGYSQFDQIFLEALAEQSIFSVSRFNPFAKLRGFSRNGEDEMVAPFRRVLLPYELKVQMDRSRTMERSNVDLFEIILSCRCELQDVLKHFIDFHRKHLRSNGIFLEYVGTDRNAMTLRLTDDLENNYRLILVPETKLEAFFIGSPEHGQLTMINEESPSDALRPQITVYSYSPQKGYRKYDNVPYGSTALDFAFIIGSALALTVKNARIHKWNGAKTPKFTGEDYAYPLHTKLADQDVVHFDADYFPARPGVHSDRESVYHATIDWFGYVTTQHGTNSLIHYFKGKLTQNI